MTFRFYDPIIQIINQLFSKDSRIYYSFRTEFKLDKLRNSNFTENVFTTLGFLDTEEERLSKPVHKHAILNKKENKQIQYTES